MEVRQKYDANPDIDQALHEYRSLMHEIQRGKLHADATHTTSFQAGLAKRSHGVLDRQSLLTSSPIGI